MNLKASNVVRSNSPSSSISLILGVVILLASVVSYALVHMNLTKVEDKIKQTQEFISQKKTQMNNKKYAELFVFEEKLLDIKNRLDIRSSQMTNLELVASKTLPETLYDNISCKVDETGVSAYTAKLTVNDVDMLARQTKSYQSGENFAKVSPSSSSLNEEGKIAADFSYEIIKKEDENKNASSITPQEESNPIQ